jgi:hypothetical protein
MLRCCPLGTIHHLRMLKVGSAKGGESEATVRLSVVRCGINSGKAMNELCLRVVPRMARSVAYWLVVTGTTEQPVFDHCCGDETRHSLLRPGPVQLSHHSSSRTLADQLYVCRERLVKLIPLCGWQTGQPIFLANTQLQLVQFLRWMSQSPGSPDRACCITPR